MPVGETTTLDKKNKKCPKCKQPMQWTEGLLRGGFRDYTKGRYSCMPCRIICTQEPSRAYRKAEKLGEKYKKLKLSPMDDRITRLSAAEQLAVLRTMQHR